MRQLKGHTNWVNSVTFAPSGEFLASGSEIMIITIGSQDNTIRIWEVKSGKEKARLQGH